MVRDSLQTCVLRRILTNHYNSICNFLYTYKTEVTNNICMLIQRRLVTMNFFALLQLIFIQACFTTSRSHTPSYALKAFSQFHQQPGKPFNSPQPTPRPTLQPKNDADYIIDEYPSETPVKSTPLEPEDRPSVFVGDEKDEKKVPQKPTLSNRDSYNVKETVPARPVIARPPATKNSHVEVPTGGAGGSRVPAMVVGDNLPESCSCVPHYQCDDDGFIITDGAGIIDPRISNPTQTPELRSNTGYSEVGSKDNHCGNYQLCCKDKSAHSMQPLRTAESCGIRNPMGINPRILTPSTLQSDSDFGEWPWMAAVLQLENNIHIFQCGGTLIDHRHVLTVAHCVAKFENNGQAKSNQQIQKGGRESQSNFQENFLVVRLGEWDTQQDTELLPHEDYKVIKIMVHPQFMNQSLWNDIAILRLDRDVTYKPHINTVCLPSLGENFDGEMCTTTGWGKNAYQGGSYSNVMKEAHLPVISKHECLKSLRATRLGVRFRLHSSFMCAGGEKGVDSCKGDGGGPLVCHRRDGTQALAGLVAWGIDCGMPGIPGVYVDVRQFLRFIQNCTQGPNPQPQLRPQQGYPAKAKNPARVAQPALQHSQGLPTPQCCRPE